MALRTYKYVAPHPVAGLFLGIPWGGVRCAAAFACSGTQSPPDVRLAAAWGIGMSASRGALAGLVASQGMRGGRWGWNGLAGRADRWGWAAIADLDSGSRPDSTLSWLLPIVHQGVVASQRAAMCAE